MKTLLLMRHAKANWKTPDITDANRTLTDRGQKAAVFMGEWLKKHKIIPDFVMSSPALRTYATAQLLTDACGFEGKIDQRQELYLTGHETYIGQIKEVADEHNTLLIVGHNPTIEEFLNALTDDYKAFRTASIAEIKVDIKSWKDFDIDTKGNLVNFWEVKKLQEANA